MTEPTHPLVQALNLLDRAEQLVCPLLTHDLYPLVKGDFGHLRATINHLRFLAHCAPTPERNPHAPPQDRTPQSPPPRCPGSQPGPPTHQQAKHPPPFPYF